MLNKYQLLLLGVFLVAAVGVQAKKSADGSKPEWARKDIRDFNDADMERLLDQWNVSDRMNHHLYVYMYIEHTIISILPHMGHVIVGHGKQFATIQIDWIVLHDN